MRSAREGLLHERVSTLEWWLGYALENWAPAGSDKAEKARKLLDGRSEQPAPVDGKFVDVPVTRRARVTLVGRLTLGRHLQQARWRQTTSVALTAGDLVVVGAPFRPGLGRVVPGDLIDLSGITAPADDDLLYRVEPEESR